jgi:hypothetical protein
MAIFALGIATSAAATLPDLHLLSGDKFPVVAEVIRSGKVTAKRYPGAN